MKRVLFALHLPPPVHGAAVVGQSIKESVLVNHSFDCKYINISLSDRLVDIGVFSIKKIFSYLKVLFQLIKTCILWHPNLIYITPNAAGNAFWKDFFLVQVLKLFGAKIIVHYHNKGVKKYSVRRFYDLAYRCFFRKIKIILLSENLYSDIDKYVSRHDVFICPNGIPDNEDAIPHGNHSLKTADSPRISLLFLSNMIASKGVWALLDACTMLYGRLNYECHFVGGWGDVDENEFKNAIKSRNLSNKVHVHGSLYGADKEAMFAKCDILVFPTFYENECFPLVLLEAMQHGMPCITTAEGGISDIVDDGRTGIIVEKQNPKELADAIETLANDPNLRATMGQRGLEKYSKEFTIQHFEERLTNILNNV